ncbi:MAG TPA: glycosyl hydrolase family 8 [Roseiarcus sp.]|nr:glycosyl hydrolase family 8 [Roseiarcus sp.]
MTFALALGLTALGLAAAARADGADNWARYKARFIAADGRLVDDAADDVSHSEGQGYGLVLAAYNDDPETFARLWAWTAAHLEIRGDHLAAWRWRPRDNPHVLDKNNATDGDLLIAWGLAEAGRRWRIAAYTAQARRIALSLAREVVFPTAFGPALRPGVHGFGPDDSPDGPLVNLSYWVFPAFEALAGVAPEVDWSGLRHSGLALYDAAKFGPFALPSDWISLKGGVAPAAGRPPVFGYELIRAPLYLAWGPPEARPRLVALAQSWLGASGGAPMVIDVKRGAITQSFADRGYRAVAALARCAAQGEKFPPELLEVLPERYYSATLHMLSLTALRVRYPQC